MAHLINKYIPHQSSSSGCQYFANENNPDNLYVDVLITNVQNTQTQPPPIQFLEVRQNPFLKNPEDYEMSIIRFQADTGEIPSIIPTIQPNQGDPNLTIYSVTLSYQANAGDTIHYAQQFLEFIPQNMSLQTPPAPNTTFNKLQVDTPYYYYTNYQAFIYLIWKAMQGAFQALSTLTTLPTNAIAPTITYDPQTQLISIYAQSSTYNSYVQVGTPPVPTPTPYNIKLYFNSPLFQLMNSFVALYFGETASNGMNYEIIIGDFNGVNDVYIPITNPTPTPANISSVVTQENPTIDLWSPVSSICFTSNLLPIISTNLTAPLIYSGGSIVQSINGNNANIITQITDISTLGSQYRPSILYNPSGQYRFISLTGNKPLNQIDINVYWKSKTGSFIPLPLQSGGSCSLKILFRKKIAKAIEGLVGNDKY